MRALITILIGAVMLSACGDKRPVTDNLAILGEWSCKTEFDVHGAQVQFHRQLEYRQDGSYAASSNGRLNGYGSHLSFVGETSGRWKLSQGELIGRTKKSTINSISATGPEFSGMSEDDLQREFLAGADDVFVGRVFIRELGLDKLVKVQQIDQLQIVTDCQRPEAARAAALAAAAEAQALREAAAN